MESTTTLACRLIACVLIGIIAGAVGLVVGVVVGGREARRRGRGGRGTKVASCCLGRGVGRCLRRLDRFEGDVMVADSVRVGSAGMRSILFGQILFGLSVLFGSVLFGSVRFGSVRFGSVRFGSVRFGSVRSCPVRFGCIIFCLVRSGFHDTVRNGADNDSASRELRLVYINCPCIEGDFRSAVTAWEGLGGV